MSIGQLIVYYDEKVQNNKKSFLIKEGENYLGSSEYCEATIILQGISNKHTKITISESGELSIEDLGGDLGTHKLNIKTSSKTKLKPHKEYSLEE